MQITLDWVINGAYGNYWWNVNETTIYLLVSVQSTPHPGLSDADQLTYDVAVAYGGVDDAQCVHAHGERVVGAVEL